MAGDTPPALHPEVVFAFPRAPHSLIRRSQESVSQILAEIALDQAYQGSHYRRLRISSWLQC